MDLALLLELHMQIMISAMDVVKVKDLILRRQMQWSITFLILRDALLPICKIVLSIFDNIY